ncbi:glycoside hydrolase family 15 protein [Acetobacteraceae bacterium KSS8]|uniref:Glycoside hydrolase family 15 protein n=1 Tax=Endosaccharibacter trunci TaxID=2812733 RepID=A0ABT1W5C9_9PROT|nr:glycoside hydrolase family 15 protein [Acetobacteraceae bacterium KSS8]
MGYEMHASEGDSRPSGPHDGFWPIADYAALGDGRSVALVAPDGSVDWWGVPNLDSPPVFDRLLDRKGGFFQLRPTEAFTCERDYLPDSNVLRTVVRTEGGEARITESLNSSFAGRLPWTEFARRIAGVSGRVSFRFLVRMGTFCGTASPWLQPTPNGCIFHVGTLLGMLRTTENVRILREEDELVEGVLEVGEGERATIAILAGDDEPLGVPSVGEIDGRIDTSDAAWREWADSLHYKGPYRDLVRRSALALKLLLYSPSGAIVAAATTSLPERIGGDKNWDYRFAWIRDAAYTANAFLRLGAVPETKAAFTWLMKRLGDHGPRVLYSLSGDIVEDQLELDEVEGYRGSRPVLVGNRATHQHQHGIYGDIFETAHSFVRYGHVLDQKSARLLAELADQCADRWRQKDAGMWELTELRHYTMSKISCWQALAHACELAKDGHIPADCLPRWTRERDRVEAWINDHCWSEEKGAYLFYPGSDRLDASLTLAVRFGFDGRQRWVSTMHAIRRELGHGPFLFRYSGAEQEEGLFLACSFWMVEALAMLDLRDEASTLFDEITAAIKPNTGTLSEMIDPKTGDQIGNTPQGLSHLALVHAACTLAGEDRAG